ncbi:STAS domain-containing protein [Micromonospora purpureochromogenes]|uniref:Anti-anti-sigma factor n=1 Tax=Micromonospora purpureochromogenes TaxID=47872 RepID=A0ABX2RRM3_9ACTN|nr:STAS domain-containing protein [Micromonospora purpureochromogenes]NYF58690.1 anti-anti-sigma factor [Micromonospora purpureochromogenes]
MPSQLLSIEVTRLDAGGARLRLTGDLDFDSAPALIAAAAQARADGHRELLIDVAGVALCDSSGLSAFLVIGRGGQVRLTGVNPQLQQLLDRTGLAELLAVEHPPAVGDEVREAG